MNQIQSKFFFSSFLFKLLLTSLSQSMVAPDPNDDGPGGGDDGLSGDDDNDEDNEDGPGPSGRRKAKGLGLGPCTHCATACIECVAST